MLLIVKNRKPYDRIVTTATCLEEAVWLARENNKTLASVKGERRIEFKQVGWESSEVDGTPTKVFDNVYVHKDWLVIDEATGTVVRPPADSHEAWVLCLSWERRTGLFETTKAERARHEREYEEHLERRRRGHKPQAWAAHTTFRSWCHNAHSEFTYDGEVDVPAPKLIREERWDYPDYRKVSKCWKDQSKRKRQYRRVATM